MQSWPAGWYLRRGGEQTSAIDLTEHDIERPQHGGHVRQHVAAAEEIHGAQMGKTLRLDRAAVGFVGPVRDKVDAELTLGGLDGGVDLASWHLVALGIELEVMDERFHRLLHLGT